nr:restriction endonuclease subunit S [Duganella violaceicalia]
MLSRLNPALAGMHTGMPTTYLKFALQSQSIQEQLHGRASGSTVTGIKQSELRKLQLTFPSLKEQRRVAGILGSLDEKIALNRRINQILEGIAQAIFKSWFVDFSPIKAKITAIQEGRDSMRAAMSAISGRLDAELDALPHDQYNQLADTAALFPAEMEDSALVAMPRGWASAALSTVCELNSSWSARTLPASVR